MALFNQSVGAVQSVSWRCSISHSFTLSVHGGVLSAHAPVEVLATDGVDDAGAGAVEEQALDVVGAVHAHHLLLASAHTTTHHTMDQHTECRDVTRDEATDECIACTATSQKRSKRNTRLTLLQRAKFKTADRPNDLQLV